MEHQNRRETVEHLVEQMFVFHRTVQVRLEVSVQRHQALKVLLEHQDENVSKFLMTKMIHFGTNLDYINKPNTNKVRLIKIFM